MERTESMYHQLTNLVRWDLKGPKTNAKPLSNHPNIPARLALITQTINAVISPT
jgi:hypothetical protein